MAAPLAMNMPGSQARSGGWGDAHAAFLRRGLIVAGALHYLAVLPVVAWLDLYACDLFEPLGLRLPAATAWILELPLWLVISNFIAADLLWYRYRRLDHRAWKVAAWIWILLHILLPSLVAFGAFAPFQFECQCLE